MRKIALKMLQIYIVVTLFTYLFIKYASINIRNETVFWPVAVFIYLLGVLFFYLWINSQTSLLIKINKMARSFADGNLAPEVFPTADDEIGMLYDSLHLMAGRISDHLLQTEKERDQMKTILASMVEGVLAFDAAGRLMLMNKTAEEMTGLKLEESKARYFLEILGNHQMADLLKSSISEGKRQVLETKLSPLDSEYYRVYINPIKGMDGNIQGAVMVLRNVTKMRLLEQMRSEFVANVSHELRTPLTSIKGYVETLLDGTAENIELSQKFLTIINNETERLNRLISDLLYLSQLETGRMEVAKKAIDSSELVEKAISILKPVADSKNITINTYIHPSCHIFNANQDMMEQVLINLLENALKYSPDGGEVQVEIIPHDMGTAIRVTDKGIGIPAESLTRVFERFYRVDKARSRQLGGTGLGLSIVKHIVDRHRGQVQVESQENEGTAFTVILPKH